MPRGQSVGRRLAAAHPPAHAAVVVGAQGAEAGEHGALQGDAGDDDAVARQQQGRVVEAGGGGEAAADGLQHQARDVGRHEDQRVQARAQARQRRAQRQRDVLQRQVDGDADQRRRQDDGADLRLERARVPRVRVQLHARHVA